MYEPELGQIVFGNPWHSLEAPDWLEHGLRALADGVEDVTGGNPANNSGAPFQNDVFEMRAYYWGDCECGWALMKFDEPHDDGCYQVELKRMMQTEMVGPAGGWWPHDELSRKRDAIYRRLTKKYGLPMVGCAVHCTCTHRERLRAWFEANKKGPGGHAPDCPVVLPNFRHGDFDVTWYKHLGRGTSMNRAITRSEWSRILRACLASLPASSP